MILIIYVVGLLLLNCCRCMGVSSQCKACGDYCAKKDGKRSMKSYKQKCGGGGSGSSFSFSSSGSSFRRVGRRGSKGSKRGRGSGGSKKKYDCKYDCSGWPYENCRVTKH